MRDSHERRERRRTAAAKPSSSAKPADSDAKPPPPPPKNSMASSQRRGPEALGGKWIDFRTRAWILVEETGLVMETSTLRLSKGGLYVRSMNPLKIGQPVLILLKNKPNLTAEYIKSHKYVVKGHVTDVEIEPMMCKMTFQVTLGRVDPSSTLTILDETKFWWTRSWQ